MGNQAFWTVFGATLLGVGLVVALTGFQSKSRWGTWGPFVFGCGCLVLARAMGDWPLVGVGLSAMLYAAINLKAIRGSRRP